MIYTITCNPSLDYIIGLTTLQTGIINRTEKEHIFAGGKGINVSIVLSNLKMPTKALGFVAGFTGGEIVRQLEELHVPTNFITVVHGLSRINVKVKASNEETEINGNGPMITANDLSQLYAQLDALTADDTLVLAGSIPSCLPPTLYEDIMKRLAPKGVRVVVDATKDLLTNVLPYQPFLIKPNHHELSEIMGRSLTTEDDLLSGGRHLQTQGAQYVLISRAGDGALLLTPNGKAYTGNVPKGTLVNSVGAGDSMVAGFLTGFTRYNGDAAKALQWGLATGSASAYSEELATLTGVESLLPQVQIEKL